MYCMVLYLNQLIQVGFHCKLHLHVFLKLLATVNLVEDKFIVKSVGDDLLEFVAKGLEVFVHLEDVLFTVDDVHELGVIDLLFHPKVDGLNLSVFLF